MTALVTHVDRTLARTTALTDRWKKAAPDQPLLRPAAHGLDFLARGVAFMWRNRRYLTLLKLANMAAVNLQFKLKTTRVVGRPYKMKIESTNICNTQCQLCPTGIGLKGRPKGKMSLENFKGLIDKLRWHLFALDLSMWGDPLIVPDIFRMIRHAHDRGVWTYISSNLHAFKIEPARDADKDQATQLVESGLDMLTCSLHGATQRTYELYQPGKNFEQAVAKVRHLIATRDRLGSSTPVVQLNFVVTAQNEHEKQAFQRLADELGCKAVFSTASLNVRFLGQDKDLQTLGLAADVLARKTRAHLDKWLPADRDFVLEPYRQMLDGQDLSPEQFNGHKLFDCSWPWLASVINWDGQVVTCCGNFDPAEDMGSVFEQPFAKVWNGPKYIAARKSFKRKVSGAEAKDNPCATCPGFML